MLTMLLFRRAFHALGQFGMSLVGTAAYGAFVLCGLGLLTSRHAATPHAYFLVLASSATVVVVGQSVLLAPWAGHGTREPKVVANGIRQMVRYGRWAAGGTAIGWLSLNSPYLLLPVLATLADVAVFRAAMNLYLPYQHFLVGITAALLPSLAAQASRGEGTELLDRARRAGWVLGAAAAVFGIIMLVAAGMITRVLYGGEFGDGPVRVLRWGAPLPIIWSLLFIEVTVMRALGRSEAVFRANLLAFAAVGILGLPVGAWVGAHGAMVALVCVQAAVLAAIVVGRISVRHDLAVGRVRL
jgi:O-antigen/teichoic acid export membrane protein